MGIFFQFRTSILLYKDAFLHATEANDLSIINSRFKILQFKQLWLLQLNYYEPQGSIGLSTWILILLMSQLHQSDSIQANTWPTRRRQRR